MKETLGGICISIDIQIQNRESTNGNILLTVSGKAASRMFPIMEQSQIYLFQILIALLIDFN